jgi:hypothetical protein
MPRVLSAWRLVDRTMRCSTRSRSFLLEWARENHREWFYRFEPPAAPAPETLHPARGEERPALDAEPPPPRHSPIF